MSKKPVFTNKFNNLLAFKVGEKNKNALAGVLKTQRANYTKLSDN